jgi:hypothetical protein
MKKEFRLLYGIDVKSTMSRELLYLDQALRKDPANDRHK